MAPYPTKQGRIMKKQNQKLIAIDICNSQSLVLKSCPTEAIKPMCKAIGKKTGISFRVLFAAVKRIRK